MLRYPPTEIVLSPSDVELTMKRITARKRAKANPYLSARQVTLATRTRLSRPPIEYDSYSDVSTQTGDQRDKTLSSQSDSEFEERMARMAVRDDRTTHSAQRVRGGEGRTQRQTSALTAESEQENSEEAEMAVFAEDANTHIQLRHLRGGGEAVMDDTPPRSTRFMRYLQEPDNPPDN